MGSHQENLLDDGLAQVRLCISIIQLRIFQAKNFTFLV